MRPGLIPLFSGNTIKYMTMIYNSFFYVLVFAASFFDAASKGGATTSPGAKWVVEKNSMLHINGRSNVNSFVCSINVFASRDTIICANEDRQISLSGDLHIDVMSFDCHSSLITKDLRKTLKVKEYPMMTIRFLSLQSMPISFDKAEPVKGWVEVQLAGVVKRFELSYSYSKWGSGKMLLKSSRSFCFSDFKLSPPKKLAGLIRIKDDFDVTFQLMLRPV